MAKKYYDPLSDTARIKKSLQYLFLDTEDLTNLIMPNIDNENFTFEQNWFGGKYTTDMNGNTNITDLIGHCFDTPYIEGTVTDNRCAIFIETYLISVPNSHLKDVGVDVSVICHKDSVRLSEKEERYYESIGVYGNRVDSAIQVINSAINNSDEMEHIKKKYSIGNFVLSQRNPLKLYTPGTKFYGKALSYTYSSFYQKENDKG